MRPDLLSGDDEIARDARIASMPWFPRDHIAVVFVWHDAMEPRPLCAHLADDAELERVKMESEDRGICVVFVDAKKGAITLQDDSVRRRRRTAAEQVFAHDGDNQWLTATSAVPRSTRRRLLCMADDVAHRLCREAGKAVS